jgi:hypothetical protein
MALFKRKYLDLILQGRKTQTRRTHKYEWTAGKTYGIRDRWFDRPTARILITRKFRQRLGDITLIDVRKEGYETLESYKKAWEEIYGPGSWNPELVVTVYEFVLDAKTSKLSTEEENHRL